MTSTLFEQYRSTNALVVLSRLGVHLCMRFPQNSTILRSPTNTTQTEYAEVTYPGRRSDISLENILDETYLQL